SWAPPRRSGAGKLLRRVNYYVQTSKTEHIRIPRLGDTASPGYLLSGGAAGDRLGHGLASVQRAGGLLLGLRASRLASGGLQRRRNGPKLARGQQNRLTLCVGFALIERFFCLF